MPTSYPTYKEKLVINKISKIEISAQIEIQTFSERWRHTDCEIKLVQSMFLQSTLTNLIIQIQCSKDYN